MEQLCINFANEKLQRIVDGIAGAKYELMTQTGHVHAVERPDAVNALLKTHLADTGF